MAQKGKRLLLDANGQVQIETVDVPDPGPGQVLVRVTLTQSSAGSEINGVRRRRSATAEERQQFKPNPFGYIALGHVAAVGAGVTDFKPGDRVRCSGHHASHCLVTYPPVSGGLGTADDVDIELLPDNLPDTEASFATLGDIILHGVRRAQIQIGESVAVHGLGVIGQLAVQLARWSGAYPIIGVDIENERLEMAKQLGATHVCNAARQDPVAFIQSVTQVPLSWRRVLPGLPPGVGADVQLHCSSNIQIYNTMLKAAADRGRIILVGATQGTVAIPSHELFRRELTVRGSYETGMEDPHPYWTWTRQRNRRLIEAMIARGQLNVKPLISHVIPYTDAPQTFDMMAQGGEGWMGVFFRWDEV